MKLTLLTKNRRGRRGAPRVSLFPFLAVLICTMGALVLILFAVMRQARLQAAREATAKVAKQHTDWKAERDAVQWRIEQLRQVNKKTQSQLSDLRLKLGHVEDHSRRLRQQAVQLQAAAKNLDQSETDVRRRQSGTREELQAAQAQVAEAERRLAAARKSADNRPRSYAVVPYEGPNETHRRPIYVECRADAVILQPEGVVLRSADFEGPLGPGNPLAAALRAVREHLVSQGTFNPDRDGEPYPLLLVRPSGIVAYYAARAGMQAWGSEFGYELIGEDWRMQFPPPDSRLAEVLNEVVVTARHRQQEVVAAAPMGYRGNRSRATYRAGPNGGLIREGGPSRDDDDDGYDTPGFQSQPTADRYGNAPGQGGTGPAGTGGGGPAGSGGGFGTPGPGLPYAAGGGTGGGGPVGAGGGGPVGAGGGSPGFGTGAPGSAMAGVPGGGSGGPFNPGMPGAPVGSTGGASSGGGYASSGSPAGAVASTGGVPTGGGFAPAGIGNGVGGPAGTGAPSAGGFAPPGSTSAGQSRQLPEGYVPGRPFEAPSSPPPRRSSDNSSADASPAMPLRPGEWHPSERPPSRHKEDLDDKDRGRGKRDKIELSLAEKRGRDWALRNAAHGSVPVTRPIHVECYPDRLVVLSEPGVAAAVPILFDGRTGRSVDRFIAAVWDHMEGWGIAGKGMYWRPMLKIRVAPGADGRFAELSSVLEGSGLTVQREQ